MLICYNINKLVLMNVHWDMMIVIATKYVIKHVKLIMMLHHQDVLSHVLKWVINYKIITYVIKSVETIIIHQIYIIKINN